MLSVTNYANITNPTINLHSITNYRERERIDSGYFKAARERHALPKTGQTRSLSCGFLIDVVVTVT